MNRKAWAKLMRDIDPFEDHTRARKYDIWTEELEELEDLLRRATKDPNAMQEDFAQRYGGRIADVRKRIKHIEQKLNSPEMKFERRRRECQGGLRLLAQLAHLR